MRPGRPRGTRRRSAARPCRGGAARSPHHLAAAFEGDIGIRFNGKERLDVEEYCISEGWIKVPAGKTLDRKGKPLLLKLKGSVEAFYK